MCERHNEKYVALKRYFNNKFIKVSLIFYMNSRIIETIVVCYMPTYNKLIRNKIPQIIKSNGKTPTTRILLEDEYIKEICKKTQEELTEYLEADTTAHKLEELSDLLELINALAEY